MTVLAVVKRAKNVPVIVPPAIVNVVNPNVLEAGTGIPASIFTPHDSTLVPTGLQISVLLLKCPRR